MRKYENECVGCTSQGLHCIGSSCPKQNVLHIYCDKCGEERRLYKYDERELCIGCIAEELETVEGTEDFD